MQVGARYLLQGLKNHVQGITCICVLGTNIKEPGRHDKSSDIEDSKGDYIYPSHKGRSVSHAMCVGHATQNYS